MSTTTARPRLSTPVLAVGLCVVWSTAFIWIELCLRDATAAQFAGLRSVAAVPALAVGLLVRDAAGLRTALRSARTHVLGVLLGAVNVAGFVGLQTAGFARSGIGFGAVLIYAQPLMVAVLARLFLAERLRPRQLLGLLGRVARGGARSCSARRPARAPPPASGRRCRCSSAPRRASPSARSSSRR